MKCPIDWIAAAAENRLAQQHFEPFKKHLNDCPKCCRQLDEQTAAQAWWTDASRFLDESVLADPQCDVSDSSSCDSRLFDDDDPISQLKSLGAIEPANHPEVLGQLGRYTIEREIGSGGMGVVVKAHDTELNRMVAIKILAPHLARSGAAKQRFIREGRAAAAVVHENVVAIHEVDTTAALPYLVMRFVDGISLQRYVDLYGPLSVFDALRIASQTANGLAAAHRQGIIHRDVKPANILVNHSCSRTWISDFGLARAVDDASLTRTGFIAGTPHYMSPEQARGGDVGPRSDLFSLGAVMYFMFTGRPPWRAERSLAVLHRIVSQPHRPLWKQNAQIPRRISDLVDRLLTKNVDDRPAAASDVQTELERALSELQNPESYPMNEPTASNRSTKSAWWTRPWFVAPMAAALTAIVCLNEPWKRITSTTQTFVVEPNHPDAFVEYAQGAGMPSSNVTVTYRDERDGVEVARQLQFGYPSIQVDRSQRENSGSNTTGDQSSALSLPTDVGVEAETGRTPMQNVQSINALNDPPATYPSGGQFHPPAHSGDPTKNLIIQQNTTMFEIIQLEKIISETEVLIQSNRPSI